MRMVVLESKQRFIFPNIQFPAKAVVCEDLSIVTGHKYDNSISCFPEETLAEIKTFLP